MPSKMESCVSIEASLPEHCRACVVRHRAICHSLDARELMALSRISHSRSHEAGHIILSDAEPPDFFATILSGIVKLTKTLPDGRQQIVGLLFPSDFLGRANAMRNHCNAEAATPVTLCVLPHGGFQDFLQSHPQVGADLFERTLDELDAARDWMVLLGRKCAVEKIASFLALFAKRALNANCDLRSRSQGARFDLFLSRADMADYMGLTVETVSRQMSRLRKKGLIKVLPNHQIEVPDFKALDTAANHDESCMI